ncbi:MAG TPA: TRAP transporter large permease subunit [Gammaproteobacteria bacterium]
MKIVAGAFLLLLALIGMPLFAVIAGSAMWNFHQAEIDLSVMGIEMYRIAEMPILLAIPLFTFAGYVLSESGAPGRLVRFTRAFLGWMPGGLAIVALAACAFFTAFTGASGVTIIALGALLYPALAQAGYPEKFNLGLITTSGSLGILFAPSLPLILYGVIAQQMSEGQGVSIDDLFIAGILPGLLMVVMLSAYALWVNRANRMPLEGFDRARAKAALRESAWEIPLPFVVLGGIYGGFFAVSEAAAITAVYVIVAEVFILREISWRQLPGIVRQSMILVGGVLIILGVSLASTNFLIYSGVPQKLFELIRSMVESPLGFLLLLNVFLLVLGAILDIFSALVLVVPLILPIAAQYGIHPVHLGIIFLANMQLGYSTPPVGLNLFIASYRFDRPITEIYMATLPYLGILLLSVLVITYVPALSLGLL